MSGGLALKRLTHNYNFARAKMMANSKPLTAEDSQPDSPELPSVKAHAMTRLPPELLSEVFFRVLPPKIASLRRLPPTIYQPPFVFCQICSAWRTVALNTPQLWSRVELHLPGTATHQYIAMTKMCFGRAGTLPLSLTITTETSDPGFTQNLVFDLVIPYANRIYDLNLELPSVHIESLFKLPRGMMTALECICIRILLPDNRGIEVVDAVVPAHPWIGAITAFQSCQRLRHVELSCPQGQPTGIAFFHRWGQQAVADPRTARLPWSQLVHLQLNGFYMAFDHCLEILRECTQLSSCFVAVTGPTPALDSSLPIGPITMSALQVLSVHIWEATDTRRFFRNLCLPSLKSLSITHSRGMGDAFDISTLAELQSRSVFSLTGLAIKWTTLSDPGQAARLSSFLRENSNLRALNLNFTDLEDTSLFRRLTLNKKKRKTTSLVPRLKALTVIGTWASSHGPRAWDKACSAIMTMVNSRCPEITATGRRSTALQRLVLGSPAKLSAGQSMLRRCARGGLETELYLVGRERVISSYELDEVGMQLEDTALAVRYEA